MFVEAIALLVIRTYDNQVVVIIHYVMSTENQSYPRVLLGYDCHLQFVFALIIFN